jgi:hypothetical protein
MDPFIEAEEAAGHSVKRCCELFEVSRAAYCQRRRAEPSPRDVADAELADKVRQVHTDSDGTYGSPRVTAELRHRGETCGRRRVRRLMRQAGLEGRAKKRWRTTTIPDPDVERARDLIQREFGPCTEVDRRYVGDITYIATWEGWAYLATVIDLASRKVVGWSLADHMRTELVTDALDAAFTTRQPPPGAIFHSDRGCQGGIRRSSQHLDCGGVRWVQVGVNGRSVRCAVRCGRLVGRQGGGVSIASASGRRSLAVCRAKRPPQRRVWHPRLAPGGSVKVAACRRSVRPHCRGAICPLRSERRSPSCTRSAAGCGTSLDGSAGPRRRSRESCAATRRPVVGRWSTEPRLPSGTPIDGAAARR